MSYETEREARAEFDVLIKTSPFTMTELKRCVELIAIVAEDDEVAHANEDELRHRVLQELASTNPLAAEVLKTSEIDFARWCA
jgi:hypothetical protein